MQCPNCDARFSLCADYAAHIVGCAPRDANWRVRELVLARLNAAAEQLAEEFGELEPVRTARRPLHSAA